MIEIIPNWHPALVHFPIAFATAALVLVAFGILFKTQTWAAQCLTMGRWMLWAAAIFACIAAIFGWFAYNSVAHDEPGHLAMALHRNWALAAAGALVVLAVLDEWSRRSGKKPSYVFLIFLVAAWSLVASAAWHGGELVYRHGLGVMSLPEPEEPGHHHEHGAIHDLVEMPAQGVDMSHEEAHAHNHDETAAHPQDATPESSTAGGEVTGNKTAGHTHLPGTPPHQD